MMRPIEGMDQILLTYRQALLYSGIAGIFVAATGIFLSRKPRN